MLSAGVSDAVLSPGSACFRSLLSFDASWTRNRFSRRAFMHTVNEERAMAAAPHMGFISTPGYSPAAMGISTAL